MSAERAAPAARRAALFFVLWLAFAAFLGLGGWQLYRLRWKLDLIARVDARVQAPPGAAPGPADWSRITRDADEYRHVALRGEFVAGHDTLVQASTDLGTGWWVLTPLRDADGSVVLVNRGFVPDAERDHYAAAPAGAQAVAGLLRPSEPHGRLLRTNDAAAGHWFSRDVAAIAAARRLAPADRVAPYFVDADGPGLRATSWPAGGLTVVSFPNHHLSYALTWFGLAALALFGLRIVRRECAGGHA